MFLPSDIIKFEIRRCFSSHWHRHWSFIYVGFFVGITKISSNQTFFSLPVQSDVHMDWLNVLPIQILIFMVVLRYYSSCCMSNFQDSWFHVLIILLPTTVQLDLVLQRIFAASSLASSIQFLTSPDFITPCFLLKVLLLYKFWWNNFSMLVDLIFISVLWISFVCLPCYPPFNYISIYRSQIRHMNVYKLFFIIVKRLVYDLEKSIHAQIPGWYISRWHVLRFTPSWMTDKDSTSFSEV